MSGLDHLSAVSLEYQRWADDYRDVATAAARAKAVYTTQRAKAVLRLKAGAERMSVAEAETRADADDEIAELNQTRLVSEAVADAHREKLRQLRERIATGRTYAATEREIDRMHAAGHGGAA